MCQQRFKEIHFFSVCQRETERVCVCNKSELNVAFPQASRGTHGYGSRMDRKLCFLERCDQKLRACVVCLSFLSSVGGDYRSKIGMVSYFYVCVCARSMWIVSVWSLFFEVFFPTTAVDDHWH